MGKYYNFITKLNYLLTWVFQNSGCLFGMYLMLCCNVCSANISVQAAFLHAFQKAQFDILLSRNCVVYRPNFNTQRKEESQALDLNKVIMAITINEALGMALKKARKQKNLSTLLMETRYAINQRSMQRYEKSLDSIGTLWYISGKLGIDPIDILRDAQEILAATDAVGNK